MNLEFSGRHSDKRLIATVGMHEQEATTDPPPKAIFITYSHKNTKSKDELAVHLAVLQTEGLVDAWDDKRIEAGSAWAEEIDRALDAAEVGVLLVSAHFLTSRFILTEEVPRLLRKAREGKLRIMPVILEACLWKRVPWLVALQARPSGGRQLSAGNDAERNQDWTDICEEIAGWLDSDLPVRPPNIPPSAPAQPDEASSSQPPAGHTVNPSNASETAAQSSHAAGETVRDLATAAADDPRIERILTTFRAEFASASRSIESLTDYKEMHDELHNFEFQCLPRLLAAQPMADESAREELERCTFDLEATINHLRAVEDRAQMTADKTSWINTLVRALELLQTARDENNPKEAWKACILLNRVLNTEPSKINDRMRQIAEQLDLGPLIRVLEHGIPAQNMDSTKAKALAEGINSLKLLESAMRELVKEHDTWQRLEADLRLIDNSLTRGSEELDLLWSDIQGTMGELLKESEEVWAVQLRNETSRVAEALKSSESDRDRHVVPRFRLFRRRAGQRFFQVDANLRESFAKLASIGEPLLLLLRTIDQA